MRTGIFGGSFDPVHLGHRRLAEFLQEALSLDRMLIIPAYVSPFKERTAAPDADRLAMCRLQFPEAHFTVSDMEIAASTRSYTLLTVQKLREQYPADAFFLLVGSDSLFSFDRWYHFAEILQQVTLVAVSREADETQVMEAFAEKNLRPFGTVRILPFTPLPVSSTRLREALREGKDTSGYLDESVKEYIIKKKLYKGTP